MAGMPAQAEVYHYYFGNTHSHTSYSDGGTSTPAEHFSLAKASGFDFYAVTDHALPKYPNFTPQNYEETKRQADIFTDTAFVGIAGFEYSENDGSAGTGHLNALNTASYLDATGTERQSSGVLRLAGQQPDHYRSRILQPRRRDEL